MSVHQTWIQMPSYLLDSRVSTWWVPGTVLKVATTFSSACLAAKPSHVGAEVDGSDHHLHQPTAYGRHTRTQSLLTGIVLSYLTMETREARSLLSGVRTLRGLPSAEVQFFFAWSLCFSWGCRHPCYPPKGGRPLSLASYLSVEGSSHRWTKSIDRGVLP
jgi:hypothetical protein